VATAISTAAEELSEVVEELAIVAEGLAEVVEEPAAAERKSSHRRRKRRRRDRGEGESSRDRELQPVADATEDFSEDLQAEPAEQTVEEEAFDRPQESEADRSGGRPRRRRSRRGRSRDRQRPGGAESSAEELIIDSEPIDSEPIDSEPIDSEQDESIFEPAEPAGSRLSFEEADEDHADHDDEFADETSGKVGFRNIPTWQDAIGVIVGTNLESRAKRPGNGPSRGRQQGRGSRDRRGSGNRGPRKKPS
jgi:hypothetical protein